MRMTRHYFFVLICYIFLPRFFRGGKIQTLKKLSFPPSVAASFFVRRKFIMLEIK